MRFHSLNLMGVAVVCAAGCGPVGPPSFEGFGDGATEGDGDGDPAGDGDGEPTGDGDGDDCVDADFGSQAQVYFDGFFEPGLGSDHNGECGPSPGADLSAAWIAPASGTYRATMYPETAAYMVLLRGGCEGVVEACDGFGFPNIYEFEAIAGQRYTFVFDTEFEGDNGYFSFSLEPLNDIPSDCPLDELSGPEVTVFGSTNGTSNDFASECGGEGSPDHAYVYIPSVTGLYRIDTNGSNFDTVLQVFDGWCGGGLVDCNDDYTDSLESQLVLELSAEQLYTIVVDGFGDSAGDYLLNVQLLEGPPLDLCDGADVLSTQVPHTEVWPVDFDFGGDVYMQCSLYPLERRFIWHAPADGVYRVSQTAGPNGSALTVLLDGCAGNEAQCNLVGPNSQPAIEFWAAANQEIVVVSEWDLQEPSAIEFTIDNVSMPGAGCGEPLDEGVPTMASGSTLGASDEFAGTCSFDGAPEVERWWTAPATGTYLISLEGSNYDTLLYVRDGGCDGPELGCNDDTINGQNVDLWSTVQVDLTAGQTISIFVDGYSDGGSYQLEISQL